MNNPTGGSFPAISLSTTNLAFGNQGTSTTSSPQTVTLSSVGTATVTINSVGITGLNNGDYARTTTCGATLAPGADCTVSITFSPLAAGSRPASVTVASNAAGAPHVVSLTGTGVGFSITPRTSVLTPDLSQQFGVAGGTGGSLTWAVDGVAGGTSGTGTISSSGLYTPPNVAGSHSVSVTSSQSQTSSAIVHVTNNPGVFTHHNDNARTGQNLNETVLTHANVNSGTFGKLFTYTLDGMAMASPLYVANVSIPGKGIHNVVYIATQHDTVYALDADGRTPTPLWQRSFIDPGAGITPVPPIDTGETSDITPEIGITGTPVIDPVTGTLYIVAKTKENGNYFQRLHALDITNGNEKFGGPVILQASVPGTGQGSSGGNVPFSALRQNQRPALLLSNGVVYIAFGSHGDRQPYHGWILGYDASTLQRVMMFNTSPNDSGGGIWQANGGPAADAAGNIYVITGNGGFNANANGGRDYGNTFLKISPSGTVLDYFTPSNQGTLNSNDWDLGAAGPLLLPDQSGANPHLVVSAGKNNTVYLVSRDGMGHYNSSNDNQVVQSLVNIFPYGTPEPGNYSAPVYYNGSVYFGPVADAIQAFSLINGRLSTSATSRSSHLYSYPGAALSISANGSSNGILWAVQRNGDCHFDVSCASSQPGMLTAYDAGNLGNTLFTTNQAGTRDTLDFAVKFSVPLVVNGKVFVGSMSKLTVYGLLP
jgi:hypothetical protein